MKAGLALIRLMMLYFFFYLDNSQMTPFIVNLVSFLLIHEALVLTNYLTVMMYKTGYLILTRREPDVPTFSVYLDVFNNFLFFTWFVYGNLCILTDREGIEQSLIQNKMLTYYITVMVLLGFFIYSKLIFYIIFFISFCPCITYVLLFDIHQDYQNSRRITLIHQRLKEETYEDFAGRCGFTLECCIICTNEFNEKEMVISLPCNLKHTFHASCIRQWVDKRPICPLCRVELRSSDEERSPVQNVQNVQNVNEINRNANNANNANNTNNANNPNNANHVIIYERNLNENLSYFPPEIPGSNNNPNNSGNINPSNNSNM